MKNTINTEQHIYDNTKSHLESGCLHSTPLACTDYPYRHKYRMSIHQYILRKMEVMVSMTLVQNHNKFYPRRILKDRCQVENYLQGKSLNCVCYYTLNRKYHKRCKMPRRGSESNHHDRHICCSLNMRWRNIHGYRVQ